MRGERSLLGATQAAGGEIELALQLSYSSDTLLARTEGRLKKEREKEENRYAVIIKTFSMQNEISFISFISNVILILIIIVFLYTES